MAPTRIYGVRAPAIVVMLLAAAALCITAPRAALSQNNADRQASELNANAVLFSNRGDFTKALQLFDETIRLKPNVAVLYSNRGHALQKMGQLDRAIADYGRAIRLEPSAAVFYNNRADALSARGTLQESLNDFDKAIQLDPSATAFYNNRAAVHQKLHNFELAVADYTKAIQRAKPPAAVFYYNRATLYRDMGQSDRAIADIEEAVRLASTEPLFRYEHAKILIEKGRTSEALKELREVTRIDPQYVGAKSLLEFVSTTKESHSPETPPTKEERLRFILDPLIISKFTPGQDITFDSSSLRVAQVDQTQGTVIFVGSQPTPADGLHNITFLGDPRSRLSVWLENQQLKKFDQPYDSSYAILVAIDDYSHVKGYPKLTGMTKRAEELKNVLLTLGFPENNITELYDDRATSSNINKALGEFWKGRAKSTASRLFFYFGGHGGGKDEGSGYLVTYDFNPSAPTDSLLMSDLVYRHFPNLGVHHALFAIDSCSSGLALPGDFLGELKMINGRN